MLAFIRYTTLRFAVLLAVGFVCYLFGLRDVMLLIVAFVGSGILSLVVLDRQRDAFGASLGGVFTRINDRIEASSRAEDVDPHIDDARSEGERNENGA